jgi:hypothetical protein
MSFRYYLKTDEGSTEVSRASARAMLARGSTNGTLRLLSAQRDARKWGRCRVRLGCGQKVLTVEQSPKGSSNDTE